MTEYRIEKDSLGEVQVPAEAYYGAQTQRAINNFHISGLRPWRAFIWSMATIKRAAAEVNRDLGLLDRSIADGDRASRAGGDRRQVGRSIPRRSVSGGRGHQPQHERQRGDRQSGD